jgi:peptidase E
VAADGQRHILAIGGFGTPGADFPVLIRHALDLSGADRPRVCVLNTAMGDEPGAYVRMYSRLSQRGARPSHLQLFPQPNVSDPAGLLLSQDVIFVGGGSVANMLAVCAGAICWFEGGTTDSFGPELRPFTAGLGLLAGSFCPHYSSEAARRPAYQALVADGTLATGIACDDGAAAHFAGPELAGIVADGPGAAGYLVRADGTGGCTEEQLAAISLQANPQHPGD